MANLSTDQYVIKAAQGGKVDFVVIQTDDADNYRIDIHQDGKSIVIDCINYDTAVALYDLMAESWAYLI